jgi:hypothetical protein
VFGSSQMRFLYHTQRRATVSRTPLDEWSACRRDLYLTTHNTHNRQTSMPPVGFESTISAGERPQTYALGHWDRQYSVEQQYPGICLEALRKTLKNMRMCVNHQQHFKTSQYVWCRDRVLHERSDPTWTIIFSVKDTVVKCFDSFYFRDLVHSHFSCCTLPMYTA